MSEPAQARTFDYGRAVVQHAWPEDCFVQGGKSGLVFVRGTDRTYTTAFFEAFPKHPPTFIRGEGSNLIEAEDAAWANYQRILACPGPIGHEFEARGYKNGAGFCAHCGLFASKVFSPEQLGLYCGVCKDPTFWTFVDGVPYCEQHNPDKASYDALLAQLSEERDDAAIGAEITEILTRLSADEDISDP